MRSPWKVFQLEKKEAFWALKNVDLEVKQGAGADLTQRCGESGAAEAAEPDHATYSWVGGDLPSGSLLAVGTRFQPEPYRACAKCGIFHFGS